MDQAGDYIGEAIDDPGKAIDDAKAGVSTMYDAFEKAKAQAEAEGRSAEFWGDLVGKGAVEIGTAIVPVGVVAKAGKLGKIAKTAGSTVKKTTAAAARGAVDAGKKAAGILGAWTPALSRLKVAVKQRCQAAIERLRGGGKHVARRTVSISDQRRTHILDGNRTGGGHRPGLGKPGKSEFPHGMTDDQIIDTIIDIASDPASITRAGRGGRTIVEGTRDGIDVRVILESDGSIVSGFPTNMPRNPRR